MKKNIKSFLTTGIAAVVLLQSSCTKDFEEINTDPVSYTEATFDPNYVFTTAQLTYAGSTDFAYDTWRANLVYASTMIQGLSTVVSYWAGDKYLLNPAYTSAYWERSYDEQIKRIVDVVETTREKEGYSNLHHIARIWKALAFERLTDLYGDVPYFEAGMGYYTGVLYPQFDSQESIYLDLLKEVDEAVTALNTSEGGVTGDMVYGGDIDKWKRFGNTLMLRMAMRLTKVDDAVARQYAEKAVGKTMISNEDNARIKHDEAGGRATQNRNTQVFLDGGQEHYYVKWSNTFINKLKEAGDPRLKVAVTGLYPLTSDGGIPASGNQNSAFNTSFSVQKGMPNGLDLSGIAGRDVSSDPSYTAMSDYSSPHPVMLSRVAPTFVLTYAESEFLLAEAAVRWGIGGSATDHYKNGVVASITFLNQWGAALGVSDSEANSFAEGLSFSNADGLKLISEQYWIHTSICFNFYESWFNWRRTGYPELTPINYVNNATNGTIPRRFPYPAAEESTNPANYREAVARISGGDVLTSRVWWDSQ